MTKVEEEDKFTMTLAVALWLANVIKYAAENDYYTINLWEFIPKYSDLLKQKSFRAWHIMDAKDTDYIIRPKGYVFQIFGKHFGNISLETVVENSETIKFEEKEYPCILSLASKDDKNRLYLLVINRGLSQNEKFFTAASSSVNGHGE